MQKYQKTTKTNNPKTKEQKYSLKKLNLWRNLFTLKNWLFSFHKSDFTVYYCIYLNFILVVCFDILCFFSRPLIKILRAPEPKNPLAGLGLGGDLPNTFQQLATMFMQSAKGRHQLGTLNTFCQLETWKKREFKHDHANFSHFN